MPPEDWPQYELAWAEYQRQWQLMDTYLYRMCQEYPDHAALDVVQMKVLIIARTYMAGLERSANKGDGQAIQRVAQQIYAQQHEIVPIFATLTMIAEPLSPQTLATIVQLHGAFNRFLTTARQPSGQLLLFRNVRSFASKYLHFHCPAVPIYDSIAANRLDQWYQGQPSYKVCDLDDADQYYYWFCMRFWQYYQAAPSEGKTVKRLDNYLLWGHYDAFS